MSANQLYFIEVEKVRFSQKDITLFDNVNWRNRVISILEKCPIPLNIIISSVYYISEIENFTKVEDKSNRINIVINGNGGPNKVSITPWILMHRTSHALQLFGNGNRTISNRYIEDIGRLTEIHKLLEQLLGVEYNQYVFDSPPGNKSYDSANARLAALIGDTRTLRTGIKLNLERKTFDYDLAAELMTEYMIKHRVTIKTAEFKKKFENLSHTPLYEEAMQILNNLPTKLINSMNTEMLTENVGKYLMF